MESHLSEEALWASAVAARLRVLQANFADDDPKMRQDFLVQELEQSLKGCVPEKRKARLAALALRFPSGPAAGPAREAPTAEPAAETPEMLFERMLEMLPSLSSEQQAQLTQQLQLAGLLPERPAGGAFELAPELQKRLGLDGTRPLSVERGAKALSMLLDMVLTLDQLVWTLWKQVASKSVVRKEGDFAKLSGEYLTGSSEVSTAQLLQTLERTRRLTAGLLGAVGRAGGVFAKERARLFDPNAIAAVAQSEKKWNESIEFACWRKYVQLCKEYGAEGAIEKAIQEAMARAAENLMMGRPGG